MRGQIGKVFLFVLRDDRLESDFSCSKAEMWKPCVRSRCDACGAKNMACMLDDPKHCRRSAGRPEESVTAHHGQIFD